MKLNKIFAIVLLIFPVYLSAQKKTADYFHAAYFKLFSKGVLYSDAIHQGVFCEEENAEDSILQINNGINKLLLNTFAQRPWLFSTTQNNLNSQKNITDVIIDREHDAKEERLAMMVPSIENIEANPEEINVVIEKPIFWFFNTNGSLMFSQNYYSENWYQGGENNYQMLAIAHAKLLYDNKRKIQWETNFDAKLGFQTVSNDEYRSFRPTNDLLRLNTKLGYKAAKKWYYTAQAEFQTQFMRNYTHGTENVVSDFASPLKVVASVGMDYKLNVNKFDMSIYVAPFAVSWTYVDRLALSTRYGVDKNEHSRVDWGPNVTIKHKWVPVKNLTWEGRMYLFSNYGYVQWEWENTITFTFNKYISTKLFLHPRYDDSSEKYANENGSYFMFKEFLSLGLDYVF